MRRALLAVLASLALLPATQAAERAPGRLCAAAHMPRCFPVQEVSPFAAGASISCDLLSGCTVYVSRGLALNEDEFAFAFAHELGHFALRFDRHSEFDADAYAVRLLHAAGYRCRVGLEVLRRLGEHARYEAAKALCETQ